MQQLCDAFMLIRIKISEDTNTFLQLDESLPWMIKADLKAKVVPNLLLPRSA